MRLERRRDPAPYSMKCPKCEYLGFAATNRCRNCGYEFALLGRSTAARWRATEPSAAARADAPPGAARGTLPLFARTAEADDEPLVTLPPAPRPPLSVRRTPQAPRVRARSPRAPAAPVLAFPDEPEPPPSRAPVRAMPRAAIEPSGGARRAAAAALDHLLLVGLDLIVVYLTLRMLGLTMADWRLVPPGPMLVFLVFVKGAYFGVFTACGGQTLGKMAAGIQVVAEDGQTLDAARVVQRTLLGAVSMLSVGITFVPALLGPDGRALHDRVTRTRVVVVPAA